jgi:hypothetical protein
MESKISVAPASVGEITSSDRLAIAIEYFKAQQRALSNNYRFSCFNSNVVCDQTAVAVTIVVKNAIFAIFEYGEKLPNDQRPRLSKNQRRWIRNFCVINEIDVPWWVG